MLTYTIIIIICIQAHRDAYTQDNNFSFNYFLCGKEEKKYPIKIKIIQHRGGLQYKISETLMKGRYEMN